MNLLFGKQFSRDLDNICHDAKIKKRLMELIGSIKEAESLADLKNVRKIEGYSGYFRIRLGDYRLGIKIIGNQIELLRFLHRKDIYRIFP
ncbi:Toxin-antitoxin system, toxin component, RelE/ParE-like [Desulfonema limicola]|uniref:Toxin-antitoxin system, toxin component, RelE/ParE-like n=1 Tax=Desulfonema limicola TaxID=45656 RepID=A0A975GFI2_9BACT|nr:type II toxin-antitoxin system RelE/ParE family toxin [Desulfonema limicola]QTA79199.1 Toxin-antitoxin system, toxin component, RelE/ParE-like [Desulfonema limicola]